MSRWNGWLLLACCAGSAWMAQGADVTLTRATAIVMDGREPLPVRKAVADLAADCEKIFSAKPRVVDTPAAAKGPRIIISLHYNGSEPAPSGVESYRIAADPAGQIIHLQGADVRGTIYAVYEFSRRFLGVDPLHYWTDHDPPRRSSLPVPESKIESTPPAFRFRGWFINDEDLLTGWRPGKADGTAISLETWDRIFEALLRLQGNMIVPGTFIFPDEPQVRAAGERGLIITQHHIEVLGTNTWRWPNDQPYSFAKHPQILINAWRNSMRAYPRDQEVIWTVGYRGRHDRAFWLDDDSIAPTEAARAQAIRQAIDKQVELVRSERAQPRFIMNAWAEAVPFFEKGLLQLPAGVTLVWPDNGHGKIRDGGRIAKGQGVYYHTAMHDFEANQLTEMVPLERIERELGRAARAGATEYLLVNVSDVRPYPLTTRAVMDIAVQGASWKASEYLDRWSHEEFGDAAAPSIAAYYRAYFAAPGRYGPAEEETLADNAYHNYLRYILVSLIKGQPELSRKFIHISKWDSWLASVTRAASESQPRWAEARSLAREAERLLPPSRRQFFQSHIQTQLEIHDHSNRALLLASEAWSDKPSAKAKIVLVVQELKGVLKAFEAAEYGRWKGFYEEDRFVHVRHSLALAEACLAKLEGRELPQGLRLQALPEDTYFWLKAYQSTRWVDVR